MQRNSLSNVTIVNAGLGKKTGTLDFYSDQADGGSFYSTNLENKKISVAITQLSSYVTGPVDLLKMNIEGAEGDVFEEIEPKLYLIKEIIFEYHAFADLPQKLGNILTILDRNDFRYLVTDATSAKIAVPFSLASNYRCFNLVYAKKR